EVAHMRPIKPVPPTVFLLVLLSLALPALAEQPMIMREMPHPPALSQAPSEPPAADRSNLQPAAAVKSLDLPSYFNWWDSGCVTIPKYQGGFGTCWSFAACGDLESKVLIREGIEYDFAELNLVSCNPNAGTGYTGGSPMIAANYLSNMATVLEQCDPYPGDLPNLTCVNPACTFYKTVTEWRFVPNDVNAIKNAVYTYGPVMARVHVDDSWNGYDGTYCIAQPDQEPNHNVLIVGWWDDACGTGVGGWYAKNSYSYQWGDFGHFWNRYGCGGIEREVTLFSDYKDYDPDEVVYHWDTYGWRNQTGYGDGEDWALMTVEPTGSGWFWAVNLWATTSPLDYEIWVYDDFVSGQPANLLRGPVAGSLDAAGLYTLELPFLLPVTSGDPVYIVMRLDGHGYSDPIPYDDRGAPMDTNKTYISNTGSTWTALDAGDLGYGDVGIRARATDGPFERGDPMFYGDMGASLIEADAGDTVLLRPAPANSGLSPCTQSDTFCVHVTDTEGWVVWGEVETQVYLQVGYYDLLDVYVEVPLSVVDGTLDTLIATISYWRGGACQDARGDCTNPNWYGGDPYYSADSVVILANGCVGVTDAGTPPRVCELYQNKPNPFNPSTEIEYALPNACRVRLEVFNVRGEKVATLVDGVEEVGRKSVRWDGTSDAGERLASGIYLYRLKAGDATRTKKLVIAR
ncbi:MAG: C1 family peptidase, partial [Candidatus Eisenbacteria bacterium]